MGVKPISKLILKKYQQVLSILKIFSVKLWFKQKCE